MKPTHSLFFPNNLNTTTCIPNRDLWPKREMILGNFPNNFSFIYSGLKYGFSKNIYNIGSVAFAPNSCPHDTNNKIDIDRRYFVKPLLAMGPQNGYFL